MNDMDNKILVGCFIAFFYVLFFIISVIVIISNKHPYFVKYKLKIGAIIIALLSVINVRAKSEDLIMCYKPMPTNYIRIHQEFFSGKYINVKSGEKLKIKGILTQGSEKKYSYALFGKNKKLVENGDVLSIDGEFDALLEDICFEVTDTLKLGEYEIRFYLGDKKDISKSSHYLASFPLKVIK